MRYSDGVSNALAFYADEPCRICGELIKRPDLHDAVYAGYSQDNKARAAHGECWRKNIPMCEWRVK